MKKNVLVFPCGSEIALEIYRSLKHSSHFNVIGANSVDDHGKFVFENYIGGISFVNDPHFIADIKVVIKQYSIDIVYPAMDSVISKLKLNENDLGAIVISSPVETTQICLSKELTYNKLKHIICTPKVFIKEDILNYPVFVKPKIGYGSRGAKKISDYQALLLHLKDFPNSIISEFLEGEEYTVDCFTDIDGNLRFCGPRVRNRITNGISVNTVPVIENKKDFLDIAQKINKTLEFRGAWFFQLKRNSNNQLVLLEIASRLGGSSSLYRNKGINFAQLSIFDALGTKIDILENNYNIELDRALDNKYKLDISYNEVFIDFDDCIIIDKVSFNINIMNFIFQCINQNKKITILSRHSGNLVERLIELKIYGLFNRIIKIEKIEKKSDYIDNKNSIFIDDSFTERKDVFNNLNIPVFSVDMVECLIK